VRKQVEHDIIRITKSRGSQIDPKDCMKVTGADQFELIILAAQRAREISKEFVNSKRRGYVGSPVSALLEIQEGKIENTVISRTAKYK
jgi:DNA-directed RNA polymerase subunit K/omega